MGSKNVIFKPGLEVIGHRGHVSRFPDNSIEGFKSAVALGVDGLELDLVISADKKVVISHEPYMAAATVLTPEGKKIVRKQEKSYNMYRMPYDSIRQYKTGLIKNWKYHKQAKISTHKPLLEKIFQEIEEYRKEKGLSAISYYLEVKSKPKDYGIFQPYPAEFADLVMEIVKKHSLEQAVVIKSFDAEFLNALNAGYPEVETSVLLYKTTWQEKLQKLDFQPKKISPYYKQLKTREQVEELQQHGFKVIPWTVNRRRAIRKMMRLGVDGIISDYPERVLEFTTGTKN